MRYAGALIAAVMQACAAGLGGVPLAVAAPAIRATLTTNVVEGPLTSAPTPQEGQTAAATTMPSQCGSGSSRTTICVGQQLTVQTIDEQAKVLSSAVYQRNYAVQLDPRSLAIKVDVSLRQLTTTGTPVGTLKMTFAPATAPEDSQDIVVPIAADTKSPSIRSVDLTGKPDTQQVHLHVVSTFTAPNGKPVKIGTTTFASTYRCDNQFTSKPGCVNTSYTPTITSLVGLGDLTKNIRTGQSHGLPGAPGTTPLTRLADKQAIKRNREAACGTARTRELGPRPLSIRNPSCDEYPFASTYQGGAHTSIAWVSVEENSRGGGNLSQFYQDNHVLDGDAYFVKV
ncbi:NucA/NucB deoxyribonuclease domain-containing protein [Mycobacterium decipiens]|nr:NucA/NucB deoxyribonuclease domain-containing protein [Mycobacterium decipiens]